MASWMPCVWRACTPTLFGRSRVHALSLCSGATGPEDSARGLSTPRDKGSFMLPHFPQLCNSFLIPRLAVPQGASAARHVRGHAGLVGIRPVLQAVRRTPRRVPTPLGHVTRTEPPPQRFAADRRWLPRAVRLRQAPPWLRHHQPHVLVTAAVCLGASDCSVVMVPEKDVRCACWRTYWRRTL